MITLGIVLLLLAVFFKVAIFWTLGIIAVVLGAILAILGGVGRGVGGRRHYF